MKICNKGLGHIVMEMLRQHSSYDSRITYGNLMDLISRNYNLIPSRNTIKRTLKSLNTFANANIQGIGTKAGLWVDDKIGAMEVEALFAPFVTADYLAESCIQKLQRVLTGIRHSGPFQGVEKTIPRSERERQHNFLDNLNLILTAQKKRNSWALPITILTKKVNFCPAVPRSTRMEYA